MHNGGMTSNTSRSPIAPALLALLLTLLLAGCAEPPIPLKFAEPEPLTLPSGPAGEGPRLSLGLDGQLALSWMERGEQGGTLRYTSFQDDEWQAAADVVTDPDMFVNWADVPSVVPLSDDDLLAHWLSKSAASTYAYDVKVSHSTDGGATWSEPALPHDDGTPTEHGFVSINETGKDTHLIWLDGRKSANEATERSIDTSMTLRAASLDIDGSVSEEQLIDNFVCDCCRTDLANASTGRIAVYRDRTDQEIRDIYVARRIDGMWQSGVPLSNDGWEIAGCPVNGPAIAAQGDLVAVAWFTAADDEPRVHARISTDSGASFGERILISGLSPKGQVDIEILDETAVAVSWIEKGSRALVKESDVKLVPIAIDGTLGEELIVGNTNYMRSVPQMTRVGNSLVFVWTNAYDGVTSLVSVRMPFETS